MNRYDSYKDSGVEWIGEIPNGWSTNRLKWVSQIENSGIWGEDDEFPNSVNVPIPTTGQLSIDGEWYYDKMNLRNLSVDEWNKYKCIEGDIVVVKSSGSSTNIITGKCGFISQEDSEKFGFSNFLMRVRPNKMIPKLVYYFLSSNLTKQRIERMVSSTTYPNLKVDEYSNSKLLIPTIFEQQQIVSFLDSKTSLIDSLIEKTERKIELLKEKRTSIINEVVTKGLNPNVEMKDSGVEWIGEIPCHWTYGQVRRFTIDHRQGYYSTDGYTNSGHRVVRITDLKNNNKIDVSDSPYYEMSEIDKERYELKKGDFLFQRTGSHKKIGVFSSNEPSVYGSFLIRFRFSKKINHEYLRFFFNSSNYKNQLNQQIHGGVNPNIHVENIKECYTTSPPLEEQQQIVKYLDEQTQLIDKTIFIEEKRIELLEEYRQSIISEVVTGKRKVVEL